MGGGAGYQLLSFCPNFLDSTGTYAVKKNFTVYVSWSPEMANRYAEHVVWEMPCEIKLYKSINI